MGRLTLVTGGARAGKTAFALALARAHTSPVTYLATAQAHDAEMEARISRHRAERPATWRTLEEPHDPVGALVAAAPCGVVVLDCLTLWMSNLLLCHLPGDDFTIGDRDAALAHALAAAQGLVRWARESVAEVVVVTNEVGLGIVPASPLARAYADALGRVNQEVAAAAERVYLVVAGLALDLRAAGAVAARPAL